MSHQYVVVGLGLFGFSMVENLLQMGHEVLAVDTDGKRIQQLEEEGLDAQSITADPTEGNFLYELGVEDFDGAVVATGDLMANVFVTLILKDLGVPLVMAHADTKEHIRVLEQVGADSVVQPEKEFGAVASRRLVYPGTIDYLELGDGEAVVEVEVPNEWVGKSLSDLHLYKERHLTVLAHKSRGRGGNIPKGDQTFQEEDVLMIGGAKEDLDKAEFFQ
jgi:trk system potassium uptake protein